METSVYTLTRQGREGDSPESWESSREMFREKLNLYEIVLLDKQSKVGN